MENPAGIRIAIVGAGPAGIYMAAALVDQADVAAIDIFDRLPAPFGLLRYGVAPDHLKMKALATTLQRTLDHDKVRFFGNLELGRDITIDELLSDYNALVYAHGAASDRKLGIPGEDLRGSVAARRFVAWYCGDPDASADDFDLTARSVAVIGLGNVALDVTRVLIRDPAELSQTDVTDDVLEALHASGVTEIHVVGRRGPQHAKFTTKELREIGELDGVDVIVDRAALDGVGDVDDKAVARNLEVFRAWSARPLSDAPRRVIFHFFATPVEVIGTSSVEGLRIEHADGTTEELVVQMVVRSAGYRGVPMAGLPFDPTTGTISVTDHRVVRPDKRVGEYACGWIKRGATGVIGTNRSDATATMRSIETDIEALRARETRPGSALEAARARGVDPVTLEGWAAIDAAEVARGSARDNPRIKLAQWDELLAAADTTTS